LEKRCAFHEKWYGTSVRILQILVPYRVSATTALYHSCDYDMYVYFTVAGNYRVHGRPAFTNVGGVIFHV
jgi:hypothetical protein